MRLNTIGMNLRATVAVAFVLAAAAVPARAQHPIELQFDDGLVTLRVRNAPVRAVLEEWARVTGATIVAGDRVAGPPLTLDLTRVPERQALDTLLRNVAGYMLAPRRPGSTGASAFDRILILPTSAAPRNPPPQRAATSPVQPRRTVVSEQPPFGVPEDVTEQEHGDTPEEAGRAYEMPGGGRVVVPGRFQPPPVGAGFQPPATFGDDPNIVVPGGENADPASDNGGNTGAAPTTTNPFGVPFGSSATTPGVVTPVPQQGNDRGQRRPQGQR